MSTDKEIEEGKAHQQDEENYLDGAPEDDAVGVPNNQDVVHDIEAPSAGLLQLEEEDDDDTGPMPPAMLESIVDSSSPHTEKMGKKIIGGVDQIDDDGERPLPPAMMFDDSSIMKKKARDEEEAKVEITTDDEDEVGPYNPFHIGDISEVDSDARIKMRQKQQREQHAR